MTDNEVLTKIHQFSYEMLSELDKICKKYDVEYYIAYGTLLGAVRHKGFIPWDNDIDLLITRKNFEKLRHHLNELPEKYSLVMPTIHGTNRYFDSVPRLNYKYMYIKMDEDACRFYHNHNNRLDLDFFFLDKTFDNWRGKLQRYELAILYGLMNAYRHKSSFLHYSKKRRIANKILCAVGRLIPLEWMRTEVEKVATRYNNCDDANYCFNSNSVYEYLWKLMPEKAFGKPAEMLFETMMAPVPRDADTVLRVYYGDYMRLPPESERIPHWGTFRITTDRIVFEEPPDYEIII